MIPWQTVLAYDVFWVLVARQQLVDEFEVDSHRVSLALAEENDGRVRATT